jgi:hypothetical protein
LILFIASIVADTSANKLLPVKLFNADLWIKTGRDSLCKKKDLTRVCHFECPLKAFENLQVLPQFKEGPTNLTH